MGTGIRLRERLLTAWNTLRDTEQAHLLLEGPLPLWMQNAFEQEAARQDVEVGAYIFNVLREDARAIIRDGIGLEDEN